MKLIQSIILVLILSSFTSGSAITAKPYPVNKITTKFNKSYYITINFCQNGCCYSGWANMDVLTGTGAVVQNCGGHQTLLFVTVTIVPSRRTSVEDIELKGDNGAPSKTPFDPEVMQRLADSINEGRQR